MAQSSYAAGTLCIPGGVTTVLAASGTTYATLHQAQQNISSLTHQWRCNDASGSTSLAASVGSTTLTVSGSAIVGVPGLLNDGQTAVFCNSANSADKLSAAGVIPTSGSWCIELLLINYQYDNGNTYGICCANNTGSTGLAWWNNMNGYGLGYSDYSNNHITGIYSGLSAILFHAEWDGTDQYTSVNGIQVGSGASPSGGTLSGGLIVGGLNGGYWGTMIVQNIAVYNARLTAAQKLTNMSAVFRR